MQWVVITGGGSGIGRILVHHFSKNYKVLTCGRRWSALQETQRTAPLPDHVVIVQADIGQAQDRQRLVQALPSEASVYLLVQNAAIGDPAPLPEIDLAHLESSFQVNVIAPLALVQLLRPRLQTGRILHMGTSVAHRPQFGTLTYGVTKMAFHRLYQQLNAEGMVCGSLSPGLVDTEGVQDHLAKARALGLDHVDYFDQALAHHWDTPPDQLVAFIMEVLEKDEATFSSQEWRFSEWRKAVEQAKAESGAKDDDP